MVHARGARRSPSSAISRTIGFLLGSGGPHIAITLTRQPSVSARDAQHALRTALSRGGDWAELYWERHETLQLVLDDGRIEDAISGVDQGAGIRVTKGERTTYANSNVADVDDLIALAGRAARGVAEGGELHETSEPAPDELARPSTVAIDPRDGARRTILHLGAQPGPAGTHTGVRSSEAGGTLIHESVGHGLEADLNLKGLSVYSGRIGQKVASELITVIDDGTDPNKRGTAAMDDEGTPTQRTVLIEKGILRTYLSDRKHAEKLGIKRSGNARRESFRYLPICRMTNTMIARGTSDPDEILRSVKDGVFVKKMGGGQVDVVSGNFAFEITECYRIRDGKLAEPLRGATLVGQGPKLMTEIDMVGTDLGYATGTCGKDGQGAPVADAQPTLRIPSVVVGGKLK